MADETTRKDAPENGPKNRDEVALELMKFVALTTGYGKPAASGAGFAGKSKGTAEEYADALLQLFERCREVVRKA